MKSVAEQLELIRRGTEQIVPEAELVRKLERSVQTGRPLRVKLGIDPTGFDVHLGHTVVLRKLRLFQELGHQAVLIIGNYTALVGDPSGRDQARVRLTQEQVEVNARDYLKQISKVIHVDKAEVVHNGDWFSKMSFLDVLSLTGKITVQRMLERDDFSKRFRKEPSEPIYLHECLYPLMQGQDSVEIRADVELGGSEQLFNLMVGRRLQEDAEQEPQICLTMPILRGLDGVKKMGKSLGNYIGVDEPSYDQFAKTMSIADGLMREWFTLLTDRSPEEVTRLTDPLAIHPREAKLTLAGDIVRFYYGENAATAAAAEWIKRNSNKQDPSEIPEVAISQEQLTDGNMLVSKLLVALKLAPSNNEARRLIQGGGVTIGPEREKVIDVNATVTVTLGLIVRVGNRKVVRVRVE
ncbi:MAG TPA: tyrosine--tRNA ligase [Gemmataceae bacterium]|nr:tyrosine--tRNA ligase [Gemmataceae bacterium]